MIQREENVDYYGIGDKKLVIFSPICCQWNGIIDIEEKFKKYSREYTIFYVDSLSIVANSLSMIEATIKFRNYIKNYCYDAYAMIGISFGGTLLQHIADEKLLINQVIVLISAPTYADANLRNKLLLIIKLLDDNNLLEALRSLEFLVQPENAIHDIVIDDVNFIKDIHQAKKRLLEGFNLMLQADAGDKVKLLSEAAAAIIGEQSQLATLQNVLLSKQQINVIPNAGMRILDDKPDLIYQILDKLLLNQ